MANPRLGFRLHDASSPVHKGAMKWPRALLFAVGALALACGEDIDIPFEDCEGLRACAEDPACDPGPLFEVECAEEDS